jgi:SAM-dependent methyltransferase
MIEYIRVGWGKTRVALRSSDLVLDIGSGAFPNPRSDLLADMHISENRHRNGNSVAVDNRPFIQADAAKLPFADQQIDYVIVSHLAEHVDDPNAFCQELSRTAKRGYVETPSPLGDRLLDEEYHLWRVSNRNGLLHFEQKGQRSRVALGAADIFYYFYNAGEQRSKATLRLPGGPLGRAIRLGLKLVRGVLNRTGVMVTRVEFGPDAPLRWEVQPLETQTTDDGTAGPQVAAE